MSGPFGVRITVISGQKCSGEIVVAASTFLSRTFLTIDPVAADASLRQEFLAALNTFGSLERIHYYQGPRYFAAQVIQPSNTIPTWGKVFNGLVSEINLGTGVTAIDRIERWGPPGDWGTLEIAGWLTLQGLNDMTKERPMFDEVSNSNILIIPDNLSQQLQFEFIPEDAGFMVATICEYANPCRGHIVEFIYMP